MAPPRPRRRARTSERAPWPFWWAIIGIGLGGLVVIVRTDPGRQTSNAAAVPTQALASAFVDTSALIPLPDPTEPSTPSPTAATPTVTPTFPPMPTPIDVPRFSRFNPTPLTPDPELATQVASILSGIPGLVGVAIKDLETGRGVLIDPEREYPAASLFKLPVMYEVFKQRELGGLSFDETLVFTQRHLEFDLGTMDRGAGAPIQLSEALERMIVISDNSSAVMLTDRVGAFNINRDLQDLGLSHTRVLADSLVTSPYDMLAFVEMLATGQAVSPEASRDMLSIMSRQRINDRIPRFLPPGTVVAHKTGNLPGVVSDVGLVSSVEANFAVVVLVADTTREGDASLAIAEIAAAAYRHFKGTRPSPTPSSVATPTAAATATSVATPTVEATDTPTPTSTPAVTRTPTLFGAPVLITRTPTAASVGPTRTPTPRP